MFCALKKRYLPTPLFPPQQFRQRPREALKGQARSNNSTYSPKNKKNLLFNRLTAVFFFFLHCCRQQNSLKKNSLPPLKFLEGEVIWAKFNRRPWWPCEVIVDPAQGIYHRVKGGSGTLLTCCDTLDSRFGLLSIV